MKLTKAERSAILAGEHPQILRAEDSCPFEKGDVITLKEIGTYQGPIPHVSITILGIARGKKGEWIAEYSVRDERGLYLRTGGGYTRSPSESVDKEAPVVDPATLKQYAASGRLSQARRRERDEEEMRRQNRAARSELTEALSNLGAEARVEFLADVQRLCRQAKEEA